MASHFMKQYSTEKNTVYAQAYARFKNESKIFHTDKIPNINSVVIWDKESISGLLLQIEGNDKGQYYRGKDVRDAYLPITRRKIAEIDYQFRQLQRKERNEGREIPTEMPSDLLNLLYVEQAKESIYLEEIDYLKERLKKLADTIQEKSDNDMLAFGPIGNGHFHSTNSELCGQLREIDGQTVEMISERLIITQKNSPYLGMGVSDYRKFCQDWYYKRRQRDREKLPEIQAEARAKGLPIPSNYFTPNLKIPKSKLPKWPEGVKNYLTEQNIEFQKTTK